VGLRDRHPHDRQGHGQPDLTVWLAALLIQSIPYAAALLVSLASAFKLPAALLGARPAETSHSLRLQN
jgi:hypothetical protein